jgi:uncharacterized protein (TIGR00255 family)
MKSMTGFGRASADLTGGQVVVEVRTVNHRSLDIKLRSRELDGVTENALVAAIRASLKRGSVAVNVEVTSKQAGSFDQSWYEEVARSVQCLGETLGIATKPDLATIAAFAAHHRESHDRSASPRTRLSWEQISSVVDRALLLLEESRAREGASLREDLTKRLAHLSEIADELGQRTAGTAQRASAKLSARVAALLADVTVDSQRLAQEVAFIADRADVTEELVRLRAHLEHFKGLIDGTSPESADGVGRRMDFWLQEIGREFNTLASKSQDADLSVLIVDAKAELEKIREQAQNIE